MQQTSQQLEKVKETQSDDAARQLEASLMNEGLNLVWKLGKLEVCLIYTAFRCLPGKKIEGVIRNVCEMVLGDKSLPRSLLKKRAKALSIIARVFTAVGNFARSHEKVSLPLVNIGC